MSDGSVKKKKKKRHKKHGGEGEIAELAELSALKIEQGKGWKFIINLVLHSTINVVILQLLKDNINPNATYFYACSTIVSM